jgi:hypothetical protein
MSKLLKLAMAAAIGLSFGSAWAQVTGKNVLNANTNQWDPTKPTTNPEANASTGTFHAGGVAACDGCHVMHNAAPGTSGARSTKTAPWTNAVPAFLLQGADQSSTCLNCHGNDTAGGNATPWVIMNTSTTDTQMNYSPGGDFGWLNSAGPGLGLAGGHNVVASDFSLSADTKLLTAPGGTYAPPATGTAAFACSSCHDPHGRYRMQGAGATWSWAGPTVQAGLVDAISQPIYSSGSYGNLPTATGAVGSYRLLAGVGYVPASNAAIANPFVTNPPIAVAPASYNHVEAKAPASQVRVAYGSGMSEWCANCHTNIHMDSYVSGAQGASGLRHPAGQLALLKPGQFDVYNTYVSSGNLGGTGDMYTSLVPFENAAKIAYDNHTGNTADITALKNAANGNDTAGVFVASNQSNVMCLSCHRAHASAFSSMIRWNVDDTFITNSDPANFVNTQARTQPALKAGYYGRAPSDFGVYQRSLCNKCHGKD